MQKEEEIILDSHLEIDGITYKLMRTSRRKSIRLSVNEEGIVEVYAPIFLEDEKVKEFLQSNRKWVIQQKEKMEKEALKLKFPREYVNGEGFLYWGNVYILHLVPKQKEDLKWSEGFFLRRGLIKTAPDIFKEFYRNELQDFISERIKFYCNLIGISEPVWRIWDIKKNWSSYNLEDKSITFDWRLAMAPKSVVDYLIIHELTHRKYSKHNSAFWNEVVKYHPDYLTSQKYLKDHGYQLKI